MGNCHVTNCGDKRRATGEGARSQPTKCFFCGVPMVRIRLPPAASLVRTRPKASATASCDQGFALSVLLRDSVIDA
jgi:hypothetical protein